MFALLRRMELTRSAKAAFPVGVSSHLAIGHSVDPAAAERGNYHHNNISSQPDMPSQAVP